MKRTLSTISLLSAISLTIFACGDDLDTQSDYTWEHNEAADFEVLPEDAKADGMPGAFHRNRIIEDSLFVDVNSIDAEGLQQFLEENPYGTRSFLADEMVNGTPASKAIIEASKAEGINPILMVARMQVEKSLISATSRPSSHSIDFAFGCGCFDNQKCNEAFRGLDKQIRCAAQSLRANYDRSVDGTGQWRAGQARNSLDPLRVVPANHATASLYAYTPWVLERRGGNWLVWNINRRFYNHMDSLGVLNKNPAGSAWIGTPCSDDDDCLFAHGSNTGRCFMFSSTDTEGDELEPKGFCSLSCEGYCPDKSGHAVTFCVEAFEGDGICTAQAKEENDYCDNIDGTETTKMDRFIGTSRAPEGSADVCWPS